MQQRKAAIADRLRQAGIPIKHSGVPGGGAQQEAAGSAPGFAFGGGGGSAGTSNSTYHATRPGQQMPRGDSAYGSWVAAGAAADGTHGSRDDAAEAADCGAASALDGTADAAQGGDVCIDVERGFHQWMKEVSGACGSGMKGLPDNHLALMVTAALYTWLWHLDCGAPR